MALGLCQRLEYQVGAPETIECPRQVERPNGTFRLSSDCLGKCPKECAGIYALLVLHDPAWLDPAPQIAPWHNKAVPATDPQNGPGEHTSGGQAHFNWLCLRLGFIT